MFGRFQKGSAENRWKEEETAVVIEEMCLLQRAAYLNRKGRHKAIEVIYHIDPFTLHRRLPLLEDDAGIIA